MKSFEIIVASADISKDGGPYVPADTLAYYVPDDAQELLEPILSKYGQDPMWYFDMLNCGRPPAPWAVACLDREYSIAGHITASRPEDSGIRFTQYTSMPDPLPADFMPRVGSIVLLHKKGLEDAQSISPLFEILWEGLKECDVTRRWILVVDPLPKKWLAQVEPEDVDRWRTTK